jgi:CheY-like chemotaxis protein
VTAAQGIGPTVLVVDDAAEMRLLLRAMLGRAGYRVIVADSGAQGLQLLEHEAPALIVVDFMMPGMDGPAFIQRVRQIPRHRDLPVLMLTAAPEERHIEAAFSAGADDFLTKPVERRIITERVEAMIRAAAQAAAIRTS